ncbi:MAG: DUF6460 domain-containing protein [Rhodospirillales bacterium]|nr:DUF6460 domain-containing protein [Rhodospirillales bacterium]
MQGVISTVIKLALISLIVGLILYWIDVRPEDILHSFPAFFETLYDQIRWVVEWSWPYIKIGAVIVVPIWLVLFLLKQVKKKRSGT